MNRRPLVILCVVGLVLAAWGSLSYLSPGHPYAALCVVAALLAGLAIFGPRPPRWYWVAPMLLLIGVASTFFAGAFGIWWFIVPYLGPPTPGRLTAVIDFGSGADQAALVLSGLAFVLYLAAATLYGFAGKKQGVKVGARTGLLVLLLLSIIPFANILGLIGFLIVTIRRTATTTATPTQPAASA